MMLSNAAHAHLMESFGEDVALVKTALDEYRKNPMPADTIPSLALRMERALESAHNAAFEKTGVQYTGPIDLLPEVR